MRKHRELIDRQHFGGPLWEGIKVRSIKEEPMVYNPEALEDKSPMSKEKGMELSKKYEKKESNYGVKEWEEIIR